MVFAPLTTWQVVHRSFLARSSLACAGKIAPKPRVVAERINDFMRFLWVEDVRMLPKSRFFASLAQRLEGADRSEASNAPAQPAVDSFRPQGLVQELRQTGGIGLLRKDADSPLVF